MGWKWRYQKLYGVCYCRKRRAIERCSTRRAVIWWQVWLQRSTYTHRMSGRPAWWRPAWRQLQRKRLRSLVLRCSSFGFGLSCFECFFFNCSWNELIEKARGQRSLRRLMSRGCGEEARRIRPPINQTRWSKRQRSRPNNNVRGLGLKTKFRASLVWFYKLHRRQEQ